VYAGNLYYAAPSAGAWFNSATGYGTLGYALPAALGASLAAPDRPVVCLVGDGGLHFTLGELATVRDCDRPLIVLVWNNEGFGEIKYAMQAESVTPVGVDLYTPQFEYLARAYGFDFAAPRDPRDLPAMLKSAAARSGPTLIRLDERIMLGDAANP